MKRLMLALLLLLPAIAFATINGVSSQHVVLPCGGGADIGKRDAANPDGVCSPPDIYFTGDFEDGQVNAVASTDNGFNVRSLPVTQSACEFTAVTNGGAGPASGLDCRVVAESSNTVGGDTNVAARAGSYFFKAYLSYTKEYEEINGYTCPDPNQDKPRCAVTLDNTAHAFDFDAETWFGYSIYLPFDWDHETGRKDNRGEVKVMQVDAGAASRESVDLSLYVNGASATTTSWMTQYLYNDTNVTQTGGTSKRAVLGNTVTDGDLGKWTDVIIRLRSNPFSGTGTCNPRTGATTGTVANCPALGSATNAVFTGNNGILEIWKSVGTAGSSALTVTGITRANPAVITYSGTDPAVGDTFYLTSVAGMTEINNKYIRVGSSLNTTANTFNAVTPAGSCTGCAASTNINSSAYTAYTSGGALTPTRGIVKVFSRTSLPMGLVPYAAEGLGWSPRAYKPGWKKNPTTVPGPVELGIDEVRFGEATVHGTGFNDVHPDGYEAP